MGYMFRLYRVIFRPSKTTDPIFTRQSSALWDPQCLHNSMRGCESFARNEYQT